MSEKEYYSSDDEENRNQNADPEVDSLTATVKQISIGKDINFKEEIRYGLLERYTQIELEEIVKIIQKCFNTIPVRNRFFWDPSKSKTIASDFVPDFVVLEKVIRIIRENRFVSKSFTIKDYLLLPSKEIAEYKEDKKDKVRLTKNQKGLFIDDIFSRLFVYDWFGSESFPLFSLDQLYDSEHFQLANVPERLHKLLYRLWFIFDQLVLECFIMLKDIPRTFFPMGMLLAPVSNKKEYFVAYLSQIRYLSQNIKHWMDDLSEENKKKGKTKEEEGSLEIVKLYTNYALRVANDLWEFTKGPWYAEFKGNILNAFKVFKTDNKNNSNEVNLDTITTYTTISNYQILTLETGNNLEDYKASFLRTVCSLMHRSPLSKLCMWLYRNFIFNISADITEHVVAINGTNRNDNLVNIKGLVSEYLSTNIIITAERMKIDDMECIYNIIKTMALNQERDFIRFVEALASGPIEGRKTESKDKSKSDKTTSQAKDTYSVDSLLTAIESTIKSLEIIQGEVRKLHRKYFAVFNCSLVTYFNTVLTTQITYMKNTQTNLEKFAKEKRSEDDMERKYQKFTERFLVYMLSLIKSEIRSLKIIHNVRTTSDGSLMARYSSAFSSLYGIDMTEKIIEPKENGKGVFINYNTAYQAKEQRDYPPKLFLSDHAIFGRFNNPKNEKMYGDFMKREIGEYSQPKKDDYPEIKFNFFNKGDGHGGEAAIKGSLQEMESFIKNPSEESNYLVSCIYIEPVIQGILHVEAVLSIIDKKNGTIWYFYTKSESAYTKYDFLPSPNKDINNKNLQEFNKREEIRGKKSLYGLEQHYKYETDLKILQAIPVQDQAPSDFASKLKNLHSVSFAEPGKTNKKREVLSAEIIEDLSDSRIVCRTYMKTRHAINMIPYQETDNLDLYPHDVDVVIPDISTEGELAGYLSNIKTNLPNIEYLTEEEREISLNGKISIQVVKSKKKLQAMPLPLKFIDGESINQYFHNVDNPMKKNDVLHTLESIAVLFIESLEQQVEGGWFYQPVYDKHPILADGIDVPPRSALTWLYTSDFGRRTYSLHGMSQRSFGPNSVPQKVLIFSDLFDNFVTREKWQQSQYFDSKQDGTLSKPYHNLDIRASNLEKIPGKLKMTLDVSSVFEQFINCLKPFGAIVRFMAINKGFNKNKTQEPEKNEKKKNKKKENADIKDDWKEGEDDETNKK
jgi:hypothetical protein